MSNHPSDLFVDVRGRMVLMVAGLALVWGDDNGLVSASSAAASGRAIGTIRFADAFCASSR
jgi:hypothetical protein